MWCHMNSLNISKVDLNRISLPIQNFKTLRDENKIYVDKTSLIASLAKLTTPIFLSRPRRFGKTLLASTFASLFSHGVKDFKGLDIENEWQDQYEYPVIMLTFSSYARVSIDVFTNDFCNDIILKFYKQFPYLKNLDIPKNITPHLLLSLFLDNIKESKIVVLIDEYDSPITHTFENELLQSQILQYMRSFFDVIKSCLYKIRFIFITGITKIAHVSLFSDINFLTDITYDSKYSSLLGLTDCEIHKYYNVYIKNAAKVLGISEKSVYSRLKSFYDGYQFSVESQETVYNPWSFLNFILNPTQGFKNYWYMSGGDT